MDRVEQAQAENSVPVEVPSEAEEEIFDLLEAQREEIKKLSREVETLRSERLAYQRAFHTATEHTVQAGQQLTEARIRHDRPLRTPFAWFIYGALMSGGVCAGVFLLLLFLSQRGVLF